MRVTTIDSHHKGSLYKNPWPSALEAGSAEMIIIYNNNNNNNNNYNCCCCCCCGCGSSFSSNPCVAGGTSAQHQLFTLSRPISFRACCGPSSTAFIERHLKAKALLAIAEVNADQRGSKKREEVGCFSLWDCGAGWGCQAGGMTFRCGPLQNATVTGGASQCMVTPPDMLRGLRLIH